MKKILLLATLCWLIPSPPPGAQDAGFLVVVNAANPTTEMERSRVGKAFLKKLKRWEGPDKLAIEPVDQDEKSPVRTAFTQAVHAKKVSAIKSYWQRMIFSGRDVPPPELGSDQAVLEFVRAEKGAVGYVSPDADLGEGVKELKLTD